jgi:serine/threonine protein kinase
MDDSSPGHHPLPPSPTPELVSYLTDIFTTSGYELRDFIGRGGFSVVYSVYSSKYDRTFAAKITDIQNPSRARACEREIYALQRLHHPHIVNLYDSWTIDKHTFMILEMCSKNSLKTLIHNSKGNPISHCFTLMAQLCEAVYHIHSHGIAHRDIKPGNVLIDSYGRAKLADFGLSVAIAHKPTCHDVAGTVSYLAPEVLRGLEYDPLRSDLWALGVTFYEMYKGMIEWPESANIAEIIAAGGLILAGQLPYRLQRVVALLTRMNPLQRPAIDEILAGGDIQAIAEGEKHEVVQAEKLPLFRQRSNPTGIFRPLIEPGIAHPVRGRSNSPSPILAKVKMPSSVREVDKIRAAIDI